MCICRIILLPLRDLHTPCEICQVYLDGLGGLLFLCIYRGIWWSYCMHFPLKGAGLFLPTIYSSPCQQRGIGSLKSKNQIVYPQGVDLSDDRFLCCTSKFCGQFRDPPPVPSSADPSGLPRAAATLAVLTSVTCLQAIDRDLDSRIPMVTPHPEAIDTSDGDPCSPAQLSRPSPSSSWSWFSGDSGGCMMLYVFFLGLNGLGKMNGKQMGILDILQVLWRWMVTHPER